MNVDQHWRLDHPKFFESRITPETLNFINRDD